ncbi:MAG TPA: hypothetical protein VJU84_04700 [Pyrinomonadaceae bacterium]|nr:hypothetical protein [Pyrinomonadaceae bacterium]
MTRLRILSLSILLLLFTGVVWLLWVKPKPVDMAQFAPANSVLYLEVNSPVDVLTTLTNTDVWKLIIENGNAPQLSAGNGWQQDFVRLTGIGPIHSVIMSRSQLAVVVTSFGATESGDTLNVKPEAALILETHTSERRIRAPVEALLEKFVAATYPAAQPERELIDGATIVQWRETKGTGQLVAAFIGSVVIIGNSRQVVENCVAVVRRRAESLKSNNDLVNARKSNGAANALVFGYVPAENSSKLVSGGIPILLGQAPADQQFQRLAQNAASKLIGSITWTSRPYRGGIEDRYDIRIAQDVIQELSPQFGTPGPISPPALTSEFYSISQYHLQDPLLAWQGLKTSISRRIDTVAAVVLNTTLRSSLTRYGIEEPERFLGAVKSPLKTIRLDEDGERQLLIAAVTDRKKLTDLFSMTMRLKGTSADDPATSIMENADGSLSVALNESLVILGHPVDVQQYYRIMRELATQADEQPTPLTHFVESGARVHVVTYTNDAERVRSCMSAIMRTYQREISSELDARFNRLPYAATQTTLTQSGLTRMTRSPLGQFSTIIPVLVPKGTQPPST